MGTGQNCTNEKFAQRVNFALRHFCTKKSLHECTKLHEGTKLHEENFAQRVNFSRVTILHEELFLHENKKEQKKLKLKI